MEGSKLLPTKRNLFFKKIVDNPLCPICSKEEESVIHVLWDCLAANDVWASGLSGVQKWKRGEGDFLRLWVNMSEVFEKDKLEKIVVMLRKVWLRRNTFVF